MISRHANEERFRRPLPADEPSPGLSADRARRGPAPLRRRWTRVPGRGLRRCRRGQHRPRRAGGAGRHRRAEPHAVPCQRLAVPQPAGAGVGRPGDRALRAGGPGAGVLRVHRHRGQRAVHQAGARVPPESRRAAAPQDHHPLGRLPRQLAGDPGVRRALQPAPPVRSLLFPRHPHRPGLPPAPRRRPRRGGVRRRRRRGAGGRHRARRPGDGLLLRGRAAGQHHGRVPGAGRLLPARARNLRPLRSAAGL